METTRLSWIKSGNLLNQCPDGAGMISAAGSASTPAVCQQRVRIKSAWTLMVIIADNQ